MVLYSLLLLTMSAMNEKDILLSSSLWWWVLFGFFFNILIIALIHLLFECLIIQIFWSSLWLQCSKSPYGYKILENYFCRLCSGFHVHTSLSFSFLTTINSSLIGFAFIPGSFAENCSLLCYPILYRCNRLFLPNALHLSLLNLILFFFRWSLQFVQIIWDSNSASHMFRIPPVSCHMQIYCI